MSPPPVLLYQYGDNMFGHRWTDGGGRLAFSVSEANRETNLVLRLQREPSWATLHSSILGPEKAWFFLGPLNSPGYICYGNQQAHIGMQNFRKLKREGSSSRYFTTQSGKEYKWKISQSKMELMDGWSCIAIYEFSHPDDEFHAKLTLKPPSLSFCTEILTSLVLIRMAIDLGWED